VWSTRAIGYGDAVLPNQWPTGNFFVGVYGNCFIGRDTNGISAGKMWLCTNSATQCYSPTYLAGIGLGGNWMIRVVANVEGPFSYPAGCPYDLPSVPIELFFADGYESGDTSAWDGTVPIELIAPWGHVSQP
jgi:hypothetical protein